jgi:SAM-dependent methyltransferase
VFLIVTLCFVDSPLEVLKEANRLLKRGGKIALGIVLRESPWGQFYQAKKNEGHRFYKYATFYSHDEVTGFLEQAGFSIERVISTLFQEPGQVKHMESPRGGFISDAGFTVILAGKNPESGNG